MVESRKRIPHFDPIATGSKKALNIWTGAPIRPSRSLPMHRTGEILTAANPCVLKARTTRERGTVREGEPVGPSNRASQRLEPTYFEKQKDPRMMKRAGMALCVVAALASAEPVTAQTPYTIERTAEAPSGGAQAAGASAANAS